MAEKMGIDLKAYIELEADAAKIDRSHEHALNRIAFFAAAEKGDLTLCPYHYQKAVIKIALLLGYRAD